MTRPISSVLKDPKLKQLFRPRMGGIISITTKSKKYVRTYVEQYNEAQKKADKNKEPEKVYVR